MGQPLALTLAALATLGGLVEDPPPPQPVAGIHGFDIVSGAVCSGEPERVVQIRVTSLLPQRMRWMTTTKGEDRTAREIEYRYGSRAFRIPDGTGRSEELEGPERQGVLLRLELRAALMLYPDGHVWEGEGDVRTCSLTGLGSLRARFDEAASTHPVEIAAFDGTGTPFESYQQIRWKKTDDRFWPESMERWRGKLLVWTETVASVDTKSRYIDGFFLPADRRGTSTRTPVGDELRELDLPPRCVHRVELLPDSGWDVAIRTDREQRTSWSDRLRSLDLALEPTTTIEVDDEGRPVACLLRLTSLPAAPPGGFVSIPAGRGFGLGVATRQEVGRGPIDKLRAALPPGARGGAPYVRFDASDVESGRAVVVLSFSGP